MWIAIGGTAVWLVASAAVGVWVGTAIRTADIDDGAHRLRRDEQTRPFAGRSA